MLIDTVFSRARHPAFWNVGRGLELPLIKLAFTDPEGFAARLDARRYPPGSRERREVLEQAEALRQADVIVLNEADWGLKPPSPRARRSSRR